jgi:hypothetical protein
MRGGARAWAWAAMSIGLFVAACGGDDDIDEPSETPDSGQDAQLMGIAAEEAGDVSSEAPADASAAPDTSHPADAAQETADASLDRAQSPDARDGSAPADAAPDARDARPQTPDATPDGADAVATMDARPDVAAPDALSDALRSDAADSPNGNDAADATPDAAGTDATPGADGNSDAAEASADDAAESGNGDADGASGEGGQGLPIQSWQIGDTVCTAGEPAQCMDDDVVRISFLIDESNNGCSLGPSEAHLFFPLGGPPVPGDYAVLAVTSDGQANSVPDGQVIVELIAPSAMWWASSGTVHVAQDGAGLAITFQDLPATDGTTNQTVLSGHLACP